MNRNDENLQQENNHFNGNKNELEVRIKKILKQLSAQNKALLKILKSKYDENKNSSNNNI